MWLRMAFDGTPYLEANGPVSMFHVYFLAPVVLIGIAVWRRAEFLIPAVLGLGHVAIVIVVQNYLRYHTPGFFILSLAAGLAMAWLWPLRPSRVALSLTGALILVGNGVYAVSGHYLYWGIPVWKLALEDG